jgi:hypothetical protein
MRRLEDELGYGISAKYEAQLHENGPARSVQVTLVRLRFNALFTLLFLFLLIYCVFTIPSPMGLAHRSLYVISGILIAVIIALIPWIGLSGSTRLGIIWAVLRVWKT